MAATRTRRASIAFALLASASLGLTACTDGGFVGGSDEVSTVSAGLAGSIDQAIDTALQLSGSTAAVVGVWTGSGEYVRGYGEGVEASAAIRAAQASQPVVCALLLDLVDKGHLALDRPVAEDLPREVGLDGITYGQLCTATSGLGDFKTDAGIGDIFANNPSRPWNDRELLAHTLARSPVAAPGVQQQITDSGALLLGRALRQAMGTRLEVLLQDHVFAPAGMHSSHYPSDPAAETRLPDGGLEGYTYPTAAGAPVCMTAVVVDPAPGAPEGTAPTTEQLRVEPIAVPEVSPSMLAGAGATISTVTDLKRFYEHYLGGSFGGDNAAALVTTLSAPAAPPAAAAPAAPAETPAPAQTPAAPAVPAVDGGWTFGVEKHGSLYGMSGAITGTLTAAYRDPASGLTVVVALNNSSAGGSFARALAFQIAAIAGDVEWGAEDQAAALAKLAVCPPAAAAPAAA